MTARSGIAVAILVLGLAPSGALGAQQRPRMMMHPDSAGGMTGMMSATKDCPMMGAMREGPQSALRHRQDLGLTDAQVKELEELHARVEGAVNAATPRMTSLHQQIATATDGDRFDEAALRAGLEQMGTLHAEMAVALLRARHDTRQALTPAQRKKLAALDGGMTKDMGGMMGMMPGMGASGCPMMQGGMHDMRKKGSDSASTRHDRQP